MNQSNNPHTAIVSVVMITYNHEDFISEAIEGVLMQKTNFPIKLILGEDCSTDNTRLICEKYQQKNPDIIQLLPSDKNLGMMPNFIRTLKACNGKYIALCEGDDFWTDPNKLQKQVDFLNLNQEYVICFHNVNICKHGKLVDDYITRNVPETTDILELAIGNYIHTPSVVFKRNWKELPSWFLVGPACDYTLHMINAQCGKIKKMSDVMAVYRVHNSNIWANQDNFTMNESIHSYLFVMIDNFEITANEVLKKRYLDTTSDLIKTCVERHQQKTANYYLNRLVEKHPLPVLEIFLAAQNPKPVQNPQSIIELAKIIIERIKNKVQHFLFRKKHA